MGNSLIDILCELRGLENVFYDLIHEPQFVHDAMRFLMEGTLKYLDTLERENLLRLNNNEFISASNTFLGSNGLALTDELPRAGSAAGQVRTGDLLRYCMAQEFSEVSPDMLEEFVLPYQGRIAAPIPNLRELSVIHAANLEVAADALKKDYVFSWKPHPGLIAAFDEAVLRKELKRGLYITEECCLVVCLRDTRTLFGEPERAWRRTAIARELAAECG